MQFNCMQFLFVVNINVLECLTSSFHLSTLNRFIMNNFAILSTKNKVKMF